MEGKSPKSQTQMKTRTLLAWSSAVGIILAPLGVKLSRGQGDFIAVDRYGRFVTNNPDWPIGSVAGWFGEFKVEWANDAVVLSTNNWVYDEERNATNTSGLFWYTKSVISTNRINPWFFNAGQGKVEIGFRSDGVVVWRKGK